MYIVECDPDVALVSSLTSLSKKRITHAAGKHQVLRKLLRQTNSMAMIDEDPLSVQPVAFLQHFQVVNHSDRDGIRILHNNSGHNRLIVLCPRLEEWILDSSKRANIDLKDYNLPTNANELHEEINFKINRFEQLIEDLKQQSNRVKVLKARLTERY